MTAFLQTSAPLTGTLGIQVLELDADHAVLRLPDTVPSHNHLGGPHAGAIFTLGESAAATLMAARFASWLDRAVPLAMSGTIEWSKLARSSVTATATMMRPGDEVEAELAAGERPEWDTEIVFVRDQDGEECARMQVRLTLKLRQPPA